MYNATIFLLATICLAQFFIIKKLRKEIKKKPDLEKLNWDDIVKRIEKQILKNETIM
jgi:uncharacterized protein YneF (UPF0154 family)